MKLLYIIPQLGSGGAEVLLLNTIKELLTKDIEIELVCLKDPHPSHEKINAFREVSQKIKITVVKNYRSVTSLTKGVCASIPDLEAIIQRFQPDVIHSHLFLSEFYSRSVTYPQAKWFSHFHNNMVQFENFSIGTLFNKQKLIQYLEKRYLFKRYEANGGNHFITISKDTFGYAHDTCGNYPVSLLPNAIDTGTYKRTVPVNFDKIRIINVGGFVANKNQSFFIEIAKELLKKTDNFEITLLGYGVLRDTVIEAIAKNGLEKHFTLPGAVNNVEEYLNASNIYVHTAMREAFGLVLLEAMACELPVISLNGQGNKDIVINDHNGYLLEEPNAAEFAEKILKVYNDKSHYRELSKNALELSKGYDLKSYTEKLLDLYNGL